MIDRDYQGELNESFLFGKGTDFPMWRSGDKGLAGLIGLPNVRGTDLEPTLADGDIGGLDTYPSRVIGVPIKVVGATPEGARTRLQPFLTAWQSPRTTEVPLDLRLPGMPEEVLRYFGRPRQIDEEAIRWHLGAWHLVATFVALDPWAYGEERDDASYGDTLEFDNPGDVADPTRSRCVLTATVGAGTAPFTITNLDDPDGLTMTFQGVEGDEVEVDLFNWEVREDGDVNNRLLTVNSGWPVLKPGTNRFEFTGFDQLAATWRPAFTA